jgi:hypothetical protein
VVARPRLSYGYDPVSPAPGARGLKRGRDDDDDDEEEAAEGGGGVAAAHAGGDEMGPLDADWDGDVAWATGVVETEDAAGPQAKVRRVADA